METKFERSNIVIRDFSKEERTFSNLILGSSNINLIII